MLYESTPAWVALFVAAASPFFAGGHVDSHSTPIRLARMSVAAAVLGGLVFAPSAARAPAAASATITPSAGVLAAATDSSRSVAGATDDGARPIVVFVHGSWSSRIAARLSAAGMRRDSIETALRRNDVCDVDRYARFRVATIGGGAAPSGPAPTLDLESLPGTPASLSARALSPGNMVRVSPTSPPDATCLREAQSDRLGVLELELLAWRVRPDGPTAFVRDLGPFDNRAVLEALGRDAFVYVESEGGGRMLDYDEGMRLLWGDAAATGDG